MEILNGPFLPSMASHQNADLNLSHQFSYLDNFTLKLLHSGNFGHLNLQYKTVNFSILSALWFNDSCEIIIHVPFIATNPFKCHPSQGLLFNALDILDATISSFWKYMNRSLLQHGLRFSLFPHHKENRSL